MPGVSALMKNEPSVPLTAFAELTGRFVLRHDGDAGQHRALFVENPSTQLAGALLRQRRRDQEQYSKGNRHHPLPCSHTKPPIAIDVSEARTGHGKPTWTRRKREECPYGTTSRRDTGARSIPSSFRIEVTDPHSRCRAPDRGIDGTYTRPG